MQRFIISLALILSMIEFNLPFALLALGFSGFAGIFIGTKSPKILLLVGLVLTISFLTWFGLT